MNKRRKTVVLGTMMLILQAGSMQAGFFSSLTNFICMPFVDIYKVGCLLIKKWEFRKFENTSRDFKKQALVTKKACLKLSEKEKKLLEKRKSIKAKIGILVKEIGESKLVNNRMPLATWKKVFQYQDLNKQEKSLSTNIELLRKKSHIPTKIRGLSLYKKMIADIKKYSAKYKGISSPQNGSVNQKFSRTIKDFTDYCQESLGVDSKKDLNIN